MMTKANKSRLATLKRQADRAAAFRRHRMLWARGQYEIPWGDGEARHAMCGDCGMELVITTHPAPNDIDIGGEAVALNCTGKREGGER